MNLEEFKQQKNRNLVKIAELMGYSRAHLYAIYIGRFVPGKKFLIALEKVDLGEVNSWTLLNVNKEKDRCELCGCVKRKRKANL